MIVKLILIGIEVLLGLFLMVYGVIYKSVLDIFFGGLLFDYAIKHLLKY